MAIPALLHVKQTPQDPLSPTEILEQTCLLTVTYLTGLFSSLLCYRTFFHPLRSFPGPRAARLCASWLSLRLRKTPTFRYFHQLHEEYGPIVRIGPSEVSIIHPEAVAIVHSAQSRCTKNAFYDNAHPMMSLHSWRDRDAHDQRRRVWSGGFGDRALRGYEKRIRVYREKLFQRLQAETAGAGLGSASNSPVDVSKWFTYYSYDIMGDLAFAQSFDMLDARKNHWAVDVLMKGLTGYRLLWPSWFFRLLATMPSLGLSKDWHRFIEFSTGTLVKRLNDEVKIPDVFASLIAPLNGRSPSGEEKNVLMGDAMLIITAGSDTTATSLTAIVYELARHPEEVSKLRSELDPIPVESNGEYLHDNIAKLPHLNGFINETFRLHPPIPAAIPRKTPPEGIVVRDVRIPGGMNVYTPQWSLGRSEAAYVDPSTFIPERWYKYPNLVRDKSAFGPFGIGPYSCIGKPLAMLNLRTTVARLVMTFDMTFPTNEDETRWMEAADDHFAMGIENMPVILTKRG
ncbi:hypothetical protein CNMCM6805_004602 [Aspergillus fumigatiaffinis]|uniref:Tryprostatin B 6-hydroxylase n=1 Tax=Aspergillus fumigatiaffinis TaxID=340414 RepID=A0A8H4M9G3_9EURO|nr:hypothetical protein CNMCM6805_004602 [Aspergillus fumigatiaffinis]KAF4236394.1 hypothetical protein CNMCM6457_002376 [Aspergillus fumigatiaffinis]